MNMIETPRQGEGKFARQTRGCGNFARVRVEVSSSVAMRVEIALDGSESNDDLRKGNFSEWFAGAIYGAEFALRVAQIRAQVRVLAIKYSWVDTHPTNIAAASAFAVWNALEFSPSPELLARIEERVLTPKVNWQIPADFDDL